MVVGPGVGIDLFGIRNLELRIQSGGVIIKHRNRSNLQLVASRVLKLGSEHCD